MGNTPPPAASAGRTGYRPPVHRFALVQFHSGSLLTCPTEPPPSLEFKWVADPEPEETEVEAEVGDGYEKRTVLQQK